MRVETYMRCALIVFIVAILVLTIRIIQKNYCYQNLSSNSTKSIIGIPEVDAIIQNPKNISAVIFDEDFQMTNLIKDDLVEIKLSKHARIILSKDLKNERCFGSEVGVIFKAQTGLVVRNENGWVLIVIEKNYDAAMIFLNGKLLDSRQIAIYDPLSTDLKKISQSVSISK